MAGRPQARLRATAVFIHGFQPHHALPAPPPQTVPAGFTQVVGAVARVGDCEAVLYEAPANANDGTFGHQLQYYERSFVVMYKTVGKFEDACRSVAQVLQCGRVDSMVNVVVHAHSMGGVLAAAIMADFHPRVIVLYDCPLGGLSPELRSLVVAAPQMAAAVGGAGGAAAGAAVVGAAVVAPVAVGVQLVPAVARLAKEGKVAEAVMSSLAIGASLALTVGLGAKFAQALGTAATSAGSVGLAWATVSAQVVLDRVLPFIAPVLLDSEHLSVVRAALRAMKEAGVSIIVCDANASAPPAPEDRRLFAPSRLGFAAYATIPWPNTPVGSDATGDNDMNQLLSLLTHAQGHCSMFLRAHDDLHTQVRTAVAEALDAAAVDRAVVAERLSLHVLAHMLAFEILAAPRRRPLA